MNDFFKKIIDQAIFQGEKTALVIGEELYSYEQILQRSFLLSYWFVKFSKETPVCIILSNKTIDLYLGMITCFFSNSIYAPLNIASSYEKNKQILSLIDNAFIYVGEIAYETLLSLTENISNKALLFSNKLLYEKFKNEDCKNTAFLIEDYATIYDERYFDYHFCYSMNKRQEIAYLFFTSGSSGKPKAVPINYQNISAYVDAIRSLFLITENDHFIQLSDIAFDISIHEIILSFISGATLYIYDEKEELSVARFIFDNKITHCILVPSSMPGIINQCQFYQCHLNSLSHTFVCGEQFPIAFARSWEKIALNSLIVNLYGPTEATVSCMYHIYQKNHDYQSLLSLPIGRPFPQIQVNITDKNELIITGKQVSNGYWYINKKNKFQFNIELNVMSYFSGDCVSLHDDYGYLFHGRMDDQWKIKGYRVEKAEVESVLRSVLNAHDICVLPHYDNNNLVESLVAFSTSEINIAYNKHKLLNFIAEKAIPSHAIKLDYIPKLPNGKVNYNLLKEKVNV